MTRLVIPDLHAPYHHPRALRWLKQVAERWSIDQVVCIGDEADLYQLSQYHKRPDIPDLKQELKQLRRAVRQLASLFPVMLLCNSNHVERMKKRVIEAGLPAELLTSWADIIGAPAGWRWADRWVLDRVVYTHGSEFRAKTAARQALDLYRSNVVIGHLHQQAGVYYRKTTAGQLWCLQTGCLVNHRHPVYDYSRLHHDKPVLGCGIVKTGGVPIFLPFEAL